MAKEWSERAGHLSPRKCPFCNGSDGTPRHTMCDCADLKVCADSLRGLVELEPSCKWPKLTLAATLTRLQAALLQTSTSGVEGDAAGEAGAASEEGAAYLAELADLDPLRKGYYASLLAGPHSHGGAA